MKKLLLLLGLSFLSLNLASYAERILLFDQDIIVHEDGSMDVVENITVNVTGNSIRHGIVRQIPLKHRIYGIFKYLARFDVKSIKINGSDSVYRVEDPKHGKNLYIGDPFKTLAPGKYTFTVSYTTEKHILAFKDHDELYWNVPGSYWRFPINQVVATVHLPSGIAENDIRTQAYTGHTGKRDSDYTVSKLGDTITFKSTQVTYPGEDFTIVVGWPKGYVNQPSFIKEFASDNFVWLIFLIGVFVLIGLIVYGKISETVASGTIIPRFSPPKGYTPSMCRYLLKGKYDYLSFSADIVLLAVQGLVKIMCIESWWKRVDYTVKRLKPDKHNGNVSMMTSLFGTKDKVEFSSRNSQSRIRAAISGEQFKLSKELSQYFTHPTGILMIQGLIIALMFIIGLIIDSEYVEYLISCLVLIPVMILSYFILRGYTKEGQELVDEIKGFQLFLRTAETERLREMAPADKSPELYERFLPYAIALNAEKNWTKSFAPIFKHLDDIGQPYQPMWWYGSGGRYRTFSASNFTSSINSFSSNISKTSFGGSSGFGSGGRSGGGGGGGGGGGW